MYKLLVRIRRTNQGTDLRPHYAHLSNKVSDTSRARVYNAPVAPLVQDSLHASRTHSPHSYIGAQCCLGADLHRERP